MKHALYWFRDGFLNWCDLNPDSTVKDTLKYLFAPTCLVAIAIAFIFRIIFPHSLYSQYWVAGGVVSALLVWFGFHHIQRLLRKS